MRQRRETNVGVVVLAQNVENTTIKARLNVVKLGHVCMLDSINKHLTPNNNEKRRENFARYEPRRQHGEAMRKDRRVMQRHSPRLVKAQLRASTWNTQTADFDDVAHSNDK
jgi:hypothetical protein